MHMHVLQIRTIVTRTLNREKLVHVKINQVYSIAIYFFSRLNPIVRTLGECYYLLRICSVKFSQFNSYVCTYLFVYIILYGRITQEHPFTKLNIFELYQILVALVVVAL